MTITRKFRTERGHAIRRMTFEVGGKGALIETGFYKKGERKPYLVKREVKG